MGLHNYHDQNGVQHVNVPGRNAFPMKGYDPVNIKNDMMLLKVYIYKKINYDCIFEVHHIALI